MKRYPILIMAYRRTMELQLVLESIKQLNPSVVYFHIHNAPDEESQKEVNEVKKLIASCEFTKKVKYEKEFLGLRRAVLSALEWISNEEDQFYVFEDDIVLHKNSAVSLDKYMTKLNKEGGVLKFGEWRERPVYWGWAVTSQTAKQLISKDVWDLPQELIAPYFDDVWHYKGTMEALKRGDGLAWDDEFGIISKFMNIKEIISKDQLTDHIGHVTTREGGYTNGTFHVSFRNGVLLPKENDNV